MTNPVDAKQLAAAANALLAHIHSQKKKSDLLDDDAFISLVVGLQRIPEKGRTKPFYAPLAHSLYKDRPVCLIISDGLYKSVKEYLKEFPVEGIEKVVSITKLRKEFSRYEDRRKLSSTFDLFLADSRLIHLLPKTLGNKFFEKKKNPAFVDISKKDIGPSLLKARDSTFFHLRSGPTIMIKIARTSFSDKQIVENFNASIDAIVNQLPKKWKGIQALYLRTATSVALPFYHSLPFTLKIQESDTPQLMRETKPKRKADSLEEKGTPSKKQALNGPASATAPFATLTLTGVKPEAEETLTPPAPVGLNPKKKLLKRKVGAASPAAAQAPSSAKKVAPASPAAPATPAPVSPATPAQQAVAASAKKKTTLKKKKVAGSPAPAQVQATPAPNTPAAQAPATPAPKTTLKKKKAATPAQVQATPVPNTPATAQAPATPASKTTLKKKKAATPAQVQAPAGEQTPATPAPKAVAAPGKKKATLKKKATPSPAPQVIATPAPKAVATSAPKTQPVGTKKAPQSPASATAQTPPALKKVRSAKSTQKKH